MGTRFDTHGCGEGRATGNPKSWRRLGVALLVTASSVFAAIGVAAGPAGASLNPVVETWGDNTYGQLGNGTTTMSTLPVSIALPGGASPVAVSAGGNHSLAIGSDNNLYAWGQNGYGQLGNGTTTQANSPIAISLPSGVHATAVAAGFIDSVVLGSNGKVYAWGDNSVGELGDGNTTNSSSPVLVSLPSTLTFTSIAAGQYHNLALASNGALYAWGYNNDGQVGNGTKNTPTSPVQISLPSGATPAKIAAGGYHSLAVSTAGNVYGWGYNAYGQVGDGSTTDRKSPIAMVMPGGVKASAVAAGLYHSMFLGTNGKVYAVGYNGNGELGIDDNINSTSVVASGMPAGTTATAIAAGLYNSYALVSNGTLYAWGENGFGQLGNGTVQAQWVPTAVSFPSNATFTGLMSDSSSEFGIAIATPTQSVTTTGLSASNTSPVYGQAETLTATVTGSDGGGTVNFEDGSTSLSGCGSVALAPSGSSYVAQCTTSTLPAGQHHFTAIYSGDTNSLGSTSSVDTLTVAQAPLVVTASSASVTYGNAPPAITASYTGFQNGDSASSLATQPTCSTTATATSSVGNYPSSCSGAAAANYSITYQNGQITVGTAPLSISASSGTMTYGGTAPTITPSYSGFQNGDTATSLATQPTCSTTATSASPVGTYPSSCSGATDPNYTISYTGGNVVVGAAPLVITASSASTTYGTPAGAITPSYSGFQNGDSASSLTTQPTCSASATVTSPVGTYTSSCSGASDPNYSISYVGGTVTVAQAPLTVTASSGSLTYGGSVPAVSPIVTGLQNGEGASVLGSGLQCSTTATSTSSVGTYASSCSGAVDSNYAITYVAGTVTVTPAPLTVTASSGSLTYGGTVPAITPTISGLQNGETASVLGGGFGCGTAATPTSPVGTYTSSCSASTDANYTVSYIDGSVTVTPAPLTVTASSATMTYGGAVPTISPIVAGLQNGEDVSVLGAGLMCSTAAVSSSPVGTYASLCSGALDSNYTIVYVEGTVTVTAASLIVTASSGSTGYGSTPAATTASYNGLVNGDTAASLTTQPTCSTTATSSSPVGTYASSCSGASDPNYVITYVAGSVTVAPVSLMITASSATMNYGSTPPTITASYNGLVNGDTAASLTTQPTCSTTATSSSPVGTYASSCSGASDSNYVITYVDGSVAVGPAALIVVASNGSMTYGGTAPTITPTYTGFVNGDTAASLTTQPTCSTTATSSSPVGTYASSCSGASDSNYDITYVNGAVAVSPAPLGVAASSASIAYGGASPAITATYSGLVSGDTVSSLTTPASCSSPVTPTTPVGTYDSSCSGASDPNYTITYVDGSVTVSPAPLSITASSGSMTYGGTVPSVTANISGLQNGEDASVLGAGLSCSTTAAPTSPVGSYPTSCSGAVDSNYTISYTAGTLVVSAAPLTVSASSGSFTYGGTPPVITPTVSGLQNGETASVLGPLTCSTTATSTSPAGTYPSSCSGATDANYAITYVNNTVQVVAAPLTVSASSGTMSYGGTPPTISPSYAGFVNGDDANSLDTAPTCTTTATSNSPVGTYASSCSGASDPNYTISYVSGDVVVGASTLVVSASSGSMTYGGSAPSITPTYSGFVNGDGPSSLTTAPTCSAGATSSSPVGTYASSCSGASDPNYNITYVSGSVHVTPAPLTVAASSASVTYGGAKPTIHATVTGLVNGDTVSSLGAGLGCSTSVGPTTPVGSYASTCSGATDPNYTITYASGTVTVAPATLTVTANNQTMQFGGTVPALTSTITGFVNGQTLATSGVTGSPVCTTTGTSTSAAGTYPITCSPGTLAATNYTFTFVSGVLTITSTSTLACYTVGQVNVASGQSVKIAPGCFVIGSITVQPGGSLESEGAIIIGFVHSNGGSLRLCSTSMALDLDESGSPNPSVIGDGTSACRGSVIIGGVALLANSGPVSFQNNQALAAVQVNNNTGSVTVKNNFVIGLLQVKGNTGTVVDRPNTVWGSAQLQ
jgi:alpha-tubulin suppressor-like RCC1 family protein